MDTRNLGLSVSGGASPERSDEVSSAALHSSSSSIPVSEPSTSPSSSSFSSPYSVNDLQSDRSSSDGVENITDTTEHFRATGSLQSPVASPLLAAQLDSDVVSDFLSWHQQGSASGGGDGIGTHNDVEVLDGADSDFSTDSSRSESQAGGDSRLLGGEGVTPGWVSTVRAAQEPTLPSNLAGERTAAAPVEYRHEAADAESGPSSLSGLVDALEMEAGTGKETTPFMSIKDLVKYSTADLLTRAWPLVPSSTRSAVFPPYQPFPPVPDILNVRYPALDEVARFMRECALEIPRRYASPTPVYMRALLVHAYVASEARRAQRASATLPDTSYTGLNSNWECDKVGAINTSDGSDDDDGDDGNGRDEHPGGNFAGYSVQATHGHRAQQLSIPVTDICNVNTFDWMVSLCTHSWEPRVPMEVICLLHQLLDRCGFGSASDALQSWGMGVFFQQLARQVDEETRRWCGVGKNKWLSSAASLMCKLAFASQSVDRLFSVLWWIVRFLEQVSDLSLCRISPWMASIATQHVSRLRFLIPTSWQKAQYVSLAHSFAEAAVKRAVEIVGFCVMSDSRSGSKCSKENEVCVLTNAGLYKVSLKPPFAVIARNEDEVPMGDCCGVFVENEKIVLQLRERTSTARFYDSQTLKLLHIQRTSNGTGPTAGGAEQEGVAVVDGAGEVGNSSACSVYVGDGRFVTPHFPSTQCALRAFFDWASVVSGTLDPAVVLVPRQCDSISVQFWILPSAPPAATSMTLLHIYSDNKLFVAVDITMNPRLATLSICFRHGDDVVATVEEGIRSEWCLWSASLTTVSGTASWTVYKDGVAVDAISASGTLVRAVHHASVSVLSGTYYGFLAGIQVWHRAQPVSELQMSAAGQQSPSAQAAMLLSLDMDEGAGCSLSGPSGMWWRCSGSSFQWVMPPKQVPHARPPRKIDFVPSGTFSVVTNGFEWAIIETTLCTWIAASGKVLEQQVLPQRVSTDCYYYNSESGRFYSTLPDGIGIRWIQANSRPTAALRKLPSIVTFTGDSAVAASASIGNGTVQASATKCLDIGICIADKVNRIMLSSSSVPGGIGAATPVTTPLVWNHLGKVSLQTVSRVLDLCSEAIKSLQGPGRAGTPFCALLVCACGRMLTQQLVSMERGCPDEIVPRLMNLLSSLQACNGVNSPVLDEAKLVLSHLHRTVLLRCVSHDFQLQLIMESQNLKDLGDILTCDHLMPLVATIVKKDVDKPFMTFLRRLKEECLAESRLILFGEHDEGESTFHASPAMLATLLALLGHDSSPKWHLVAVAMVSSLCRGVARLWESARRTSGHSESDQVLEAPSCSETELVERLAQTSIGVVVFPVAHILIDLKTEGRDGLEILTLMNETRRVLSQLVPKSLVKAPPPPPQQQHNVTDQPSPLFHGGESGVTMTQSFLETITVRTPRSLIQPHYASLKLPYAAKIEVDMVPETQKEDEIPAVTVSLMGDDLIRGRELPIPAQGESSVTIEGGGTLFISCVPKGRCKGVAITVTVTVALQTEQSHWLRDICMALCHAIVRQTHNMLLADLPRGVPIGRDSFLRGGLSIDILTSHNIPPTAAEEAMDRRDQIELLELCQNTKGETGTNATCASSMRMDEVAGSDGGGTVQRASASLFDEWSAMYNERKQLHHERVEPVVRHFCAALAWHSKPQKGALLVETLREALNVVRKRWMTIMEAVQQGKESDMLERCRFLLTAITPRMRLEAVMAESQSTEEAATHGGVYPAGVCPTQGSRSHSASGLSRLGVERRAPSGLAAALPRTFTESRLDLFQLFGSGQRGSLGSHPQYHRLQPQATSDTNNGEWTRASISKQVQDFVLSGLEGGYSLTEVVDTLLAKATQAVHHTAAYRLQEKLCKSVQNDATMISSIIGLQLQYRKKIQKVIAHSEGGARARSAPTGEQNSRPERGGPHDLGGGNADRGDSNAPRRSPEQNGDPAREQNPADTREAHPVNVQSLDEGRDLHYVEQLVGCGLEREYELQSAACSFFHRVLVTLTQHSGAGNRRGTEVLLMCAILCHPWDSVDMSILRPSVIFNFIKDFIDVHVNRKKRLAHDVHSRSRPLAAGSKPNDGSPLAWPSDSNAAYDMGLLGLNARCLILPNTIHMAPVEGLQVIEGELAVGIQVEGVSVCCAAQNGWQTTKVNGSPSKQDGEGDVHGATGSPVPLAGGKSATPEVYYFEVTIELVLSDKAFILVGVTESVRLNSPSQGNDNLISYQSDGKVRDGATVSTLSNAWVTGDVIGCGVLSATRSVFFTRNGEFLGVAATASSAAMMPFFAVDGKQSLVKLLVNFGEKQPFRFNFTTLHSTCQQRLITPKMLSDGAFIVLQYMIMMCYRNLLQDEGRDQTASVRDSVSAQLECAAGFLNDVVSQLISMLGALHDTIDQRGELLTESALAKAKGGVERLTELLVSLFHAVDIACDCFRFDAVTASTHSNILHLCTTALLHSKDPWVKVRAARCVTSIISTLRVDYLSDAIAVLEQHVPPTAIVQQLVALARHHIASDVKPPMRYIPRWTTGKTVVEGKGAFFGSQPVPQTGTTTVGFRTVRSNQQGNGAPLGGCYYVGLIAGQPRIRDMASLTSRSDAYVLQDTDDQDQVRHLLLRRHSIPRNFHRRIFGNGETVWVEYDADRGEIRFYRENMHFIGLAFANVDPNEILYPFAFLYNADAQCEIKSLPLSHEKPVEAWMDGVQHSEAIAALQRLHVTPQFSEVVSDYIDRAIESKEGGLDDCLIALAILGGQRSYVLCQHESHGTVVIHSILGNGTKAMVHLEQDPERHLFPLATDTLHPLFVQPPIFSHPLYTGEALRCVKLLTNQLAAIVSEAKFIDPLKKKEQAHRDEIEREYREAQSTLHIDLVGLLRLVTVSKVSGVSPATSPKRWTDGSGPSEPMVSPTAKASSPRAVSASLAHVKVTGVAVAESMTDTSYDDQSYFVEDGATRKAATVPPISIDRRCTSRNTYTPTPFIAVTGGPSSPACCIQGSVLQGATHAFAVLIDTPMKDHTPKSHVYIGVASSSLMMPLPSSHEEVKSSPHIWALCDQDTPESNSHYCSMEPGMIFGSNHQLFSSGDIVVTQLDRREGTLSFSRIRKGNRIDFGVVFEGVPQDLSLRPFVYIGAESTVVFSLSDGITFPCRGVFPPSSFANSTWTAFACTVCEANLSNAICYQSDNGISLCADCFGNWQLPQTRFYVCGIQPPLPPYLVSCHCPKVLRVGDLVDFEEAPVANWAEGKCVNIELTGTEGIATREGAYMVTEPLSVFGDSRVDITLSHVSGVEGHCFGGLMPYTPMWCTGNQTSQETSVGCGSMAVSTTRIPNGSKCMFALQLQDAKASKRYKMSNSFVGLTSLSDGHHTLSRWDFEKLVGRTVWGTWAEVTRHSADSNTIFLLVDAVSGLLQISGSLVELRRGQTHASTSLPMGNEQELRLAIYVSETCIVKSLPGYVSLEGCPHDGVNSLNPIAVGLAPAGSILPSTQDLLSSSLMLYNTESRNSKYAPMWVFEAQLRSESVFFVIGDTITVLKSGQSVRVLRNGLALAHAELSGEVLGGRTRILVQLSIRGMTASLVAPLFGKTRIGRVVRMHCDDVAVVEDVVTATFRQRCPPAKFVVFRKDVRLCATAATMEEGTAPISVGSIVAYQQNGITAPKRGVVVDVADGTVILSGQVGDRGVSSVLLSQCYPLDNEDTTVQRPLHPLISRPTSSKTNAFAVGKTRFQPLKRASYNGLMFDCQARENIELVGISAISRTVGYHRVEVFFKNGSHKGHERKPQSWTKVFTQLVELHTDAYYTIEFSGIPIAMSETFAIYINTSHNCAVCYYAKDDGCRGEWGSVMDSDNAITVMVGRISDNSSPFAVIPTNPGGFYGTLLYNLRNGMRIPQIESDQHGRVIDTTPASGEATALVCRPPRIAPSNHLEFSVNVHTSAAVISKIVLPVVAGLPVEDVGTSGYSGYQRAHEVHPPDDALVEEPSGEVTASDLRSATHQATHHPRSLAMIGAPLARYSEAPANFTVTVFYRRVDETLREQHYSTCSTGDPSHVVGGAREATTVVRAHWGSSDESSESSADDSWSWLWASSHTFVSPITNVEISGCPTLLAPGVYVFRATLLDEGHGAEWGQSSCHVTFARSLSTYVRSNSLVAVANLTGTMFMYPDPRGTSVSGQLRKLLSGSSMNQNGIASYNGIMFDLQSNQDIVVEEIFCIAQTVTDDVSVRVFWKEGSWEGSERNSYDWQEVASSTKALVDKAPFSVGKLSIHMHAWQPYALYINTSSSSGITFYNMSEGRFQRSGEEFEDDGILTVYVGRKSESSTPFASIPTDPRAFRGVIAYRTFSVASAEPPRNEFAFPFFRGFVTSRMLAAVLAFLDSTSASKIASGDVASSSLLDMRTLLATVECLAAAAQATPKCIPETTEALLVSDLSKTTIDELRKTVVQLISPAQEPSPFSTFAAGDSAILVDTADNGSGDHCWDAQRTAPLLRLIDTGDGASGLAQVTEADVAAILSERGVAHASALTAARARQVRLNQLLPVVQCPMCHLPLTLLSECPMTGGRHTQPMDSETRNMSLIVSHLSNTRGIDVFEAFVAARAAAQNDAQSLDATIAGISGQSSVRPVSVATNSSTVHFDIPAPMITMADDDSAAQDIICPFVWCELLRAFVALKLSLMEEGRLSASLLTDFSLNRASSSDRRQLASVFSVALDIRYEGPADAAATAAVYFCPLEREVLCFTSRNSPCVVSLPTTATRVHCAHLQRDGMVSFRLVVSRASLPPLTAPIRHRRTWLWMNGFDSVMLEPQGVAFLQGSLSPLHWPESKSRVCPLVVSSTTERGVFLELRVYGQRTKSPSKRTFISQCFSAICNETLEIVVTINGDVAIHDRKDTILCCITSEAIEKEDFSLVDSSVAIMNAWQDGIEVTLRESAKPLNVDPLAQASAPSREAAQLDAEGSSYNPEWECCDRDKVTISPGKDKASCMKTIFGQVVLGTELPRAGKSAFVIQFSRSDKKVGESLGSGHFAGVAVSTFDELAIHFQRVRDLEKQIWAVQDIYDGDSQVSQEVIPPIVDRTDLMYLVGTNLVFILDHKARTLSLVRDKEAPLVIYRNIPERAALRPFVRLDNETTSATISSYSFRPAYSPQQSISVLNDTLPGTISTPSSIRRLPLPVVLASYPVLRKFVEGLHPVLQQTVHNSWLVSVPHCRFEYRLNMVISELFDRGAFSKEALRCSEAEAGAFLSQEGHLCASLVHLLSEATTDEYVVVDPRWVRSVDTRSMLTQEAPERVVFQLPSEYDVLGVCCKSPLMVRLLYFDGMQMPSERTLHILPLDSDDVAVRKENSVVRNSCTMHQHLVLLPVFGTPSICGVITEGWFDTTLEAFLDDASPSLVGSADSNIDIPLPQSRGATTPCRVSAGYDASRKVLTSQMESWIAPSLMCAVEHWHLHDLTHGHIHPKNVFVRMAGGGNDVVSCALWNVYLLPYDSPYASPELTSKATRTIHGDSWSCGKVLSAFTRLMVENDELRNAVAEMVKFDPPSRISLTSAIRRSNVLLAEQHSQNVPRTRFTTGLRLRGGTGSYNGIMFDVVAKMSTLRITQITFDADTAANAVVLLFYRQGTFLGVETMAQFWRKVVEQNVTLSEGVECTLSNFAPIEVPAGQRVAFFIHTSNSNGVRFYSEPDGVTADVGMIQEENADLGITVGKKSEGMAPFTAILHQKRYLRGSITYYLVGPKDSRRSSLVPFSKGVSELSEVPAVSSFAQPVVRYQSAVRAGRKSKRALPVAHALTGTEASAGYIAAEMGKLALVQFHDGRRLWCSRTSLSDEVMQAPQWPPTFLKDFGLKGSSDQSLVSRHLGHQQSALYHSYVRQPLLFKKKHHLAVATGDNPRRQLLRRGDSRMSVVHSRIGPQAIAAASRRATATAERTSQQVTNGSSGAGSPHPSSRGASTAGGTISTSWLEPTEGPATEFTVKCGDHFVSQPIRRPCVVLFRVVHRTASNLDCAVCIDGDQSAAIPMTSHSFLVFDDTRRCVIAHTSDGNHTVLRRLTTELASQSMSISVTLSTVHASDGQPIRVKGFVKVAAVRLAHLEKVIVLPVSRNGAFISLHATPSLTAPNSCFAVSFGDVLLNFRVRENFGVGVSEIQCTSPNIEYKDARIRVLPSHVGGSTRDGMGDSTAPAAIDPTNVSETLLCVPIRRPGAIVRDEMQLLPLAVGLNYFFVELTQKAGRQSAVQKVPVKFAAPPQHLEVSACTVRQILQTSHARSITLSPLFGENELHDIEMELISLPWRPIKVMLQLTQAEWSVEVPIPLIPPQYLIPDGQQMRVTRVRLVVDMKRHSALVSVDGLPAVDASQGNPVPLGAELAISLVCVASSVRILSWRKTSASAAHKEDDMWSRARLLQMGSSLPSPHVAPEPGTITRHSADSAAGRDPRSRMQANATAIMCAASDAADDPSSTSPAGDSAQSVEVAAGKRVEQLIAAYSVAVLEKVLAMKGIVQTVPSRGYVEMLRFCNLRSSLPVQHAIVDDLREGSASILAEVCTTLAMPIAKQCEADVRNGIYILRLAMKDKVSRRMIRSPFGESLLLLLARIAAVYTRTTRHDALRVILELLKLDSLPLVPHHLLLSSLAPSLSMMYGLCRRKKLSAVVVQLGVSIVSELFRRYRVERPMYATPGRNSPLPFPVVICTREVLRALSSEVPQPLPNIVKLISNPHQVLVTETVGAQTALGLVPVFFTFTQPFTCTFGVRAFQIELQANRKGEVICGWEIEQSRSKRTPSATTPRAAPWAQEVGEATHAATPLPVGDVGAGANTQAPPYPSCGFIIEPDGKVFVCLNRVKDAAPITARAEPGMVVFVKCSYHDMSLSIVLYQDGKRRAATDFTPCEDEIIGNPALHIQNKGDAVVRFDATDLLRSAGAWTLDDARGANMADGYAAYLKDPTAVDESTVPQSYEFYVELAGFADNALTATQLNQLRLMPTVSCETAAVASKTSGEKGVCVAAHELVPFPLLSNYLNVNLLSDKVDLLPLAPYIQRQNALDSLLGAFSHLVDLRRNTELVNLWRQVKSLCTSAARRDIQVDTLKPFTSRAGVKGSVVIHSMRAQPSVRLSATATLARSFFGQIYQQLQPSVIKMYYASPMFSVKLAGFGSTDAGGPYRDVLSQLAAEIMTTHPSGNFQMNPLFCPSKHSGSTAIVPKLRLMQNSQTPLMLQFLGKLLAAFFLTADILPVSLPSLFWKRLQLEDVGLRDLLPIDPNISSLLAPAALMSCEADELEESFPGMLRSWQAHCIREGFATNPDDVLIPAPSEEIAKRLASFLVDYELHRYDEAIAHIRRGFDEVLPLYTLQAFRWEDVERRIAGVQTLSFEALQRECTVSLPSRDAEMFWEVVSKMSDADRMLLLRFTTGQSRLPLRQPIKIQLRDTNRDTLPVSSTCFFILKIPQYSSIRVMEERILYAIRQCNAIDADGHAVEQLILEE